MESFGTLLREKREEKKLTIEIVARDTIISRHYIEALESENIDIFPGHTYAIGFLRNYSEYLELDATYIVKLFTGKIIQETPTPENLIISRRISKKAVVGIVVSSILILCIGALLAVYFLIIRPQNLAVVPINMEKEQRQEYILSSIPFQRRLYEGDVLKILTAEEPIELIVDDTLSALALQTPIGLQFIELGEELEMDINGINGADIVIFLSDISSTDKSLGAEVRMFLKAGSNMASFSPSLPNSDNIPLESEIALPAGATQKVILQDNRPYPFTIDISFRGECLFRYQSDRNDTVEGLFTSGDTLIMQAQNSLRLWMSNANAVKMEVIADGRTYDLEIGRPGEVVVQDVRWILEDDGVYKIVVVEVD